MTDYQRVAAAIRFIRDSAVEQPSLDEIARHIGLSPFHFQRLFKRFAGVSPKRFLQYLTAEYAKQLLRQSESILETSFAVGLSSPGRLHDLLINVEAVTPGQFKSLGAGLDIVYGFHQTRFGRTFIAVTERGICRLEFVAAETAEQVLFRLKRAWPNAGLEPDQTTTAQHIARIFTAPGAAGRDRPLPLLLKGTNFQLRVWRALLEIPPGHLVSYSFLAEKIDRPGAARAVGTAVGNNPLGYLIPCHRVLRSNGDIGGYRWGNERKLAILGHEFSTLEG